MKSRDLIILITILIVIVSCNNDDDSGQLFVSCNHGNNLAQENVINGTWNLGKVGSGFQGGMYINYACGEVIWKFNEAMGVLIVENNVVENILISRSKVINSGLKSGTYDYEVKFENDIPFLFINDSKTNPIFLSNGKLEIGYSPAADGIISEFKR